MRLFCWLSVVGLLVSCEPSALFLDVQNAVVKVEQSLPAPIIAPAGGVFRTNQPFTIATTEAGAHLIYSTDGSGLIYNSHGEVASPTFRTFSESVSLPALGSGLGQYFVRAVSWKDGLASKETSVTFTIAGSGATVWSQSRSGQGLAAALGPDGARYTGGTSSQGPGVASGFVTRWSATGSPLWSVTIAGNSASASARVTGLSALASGGVWVSGTFDQPSLYTVGPGPVTLDTTGTRTNASLTGAAGFVLWIDDTGVCQQAVYIQSLDVDSEFNGIAYDAVVAKAFVASTFFDPLGSATAIVRRVNAAGLTLGPYAGPVLTTAGSTGFLLSIPSTGGITKLGNVVAAPSAAQTWFQSVAVNSSLGLVIVGGSMQGSGTGLLAAYGLGNVSGLDGYRTPLVLATDQSLGPIWNTGALPASSPTPYTSAQLYSKINAVALTGSAVVVVGGVVAPPGMDWAWGSGNPQGTVAGGNGFVLALNSSGASQASVVIQGSGASNVRGLAVDATNNVYVAGELGSGVSSLYQVPNMAPVGSASGSAASNPLLMKLDSGLTTVQWLTSSTGATANGSAAAVAHDPLNSVDRALVSGQQSGDLAWEVFD